MKLPSILLNLNLLRQRFALRNPGKAEAENIPPQSPAE